MAINAFADMNKFILPLFLAILLSGCGSNGELAQLDGNSCIFTVGSGECQVYGVDFTASDEWYCYVDYADSADGWISVEPSRGDAGRHNPVICVGENNGEEEREARVVVKCHNKSVVYNVVQSGKQPEGGSGDPELPGGGDVGEEMLMSLLGSIEVAEYNSRQELLNESKVEFDYNADGLINLMVWSDNASSGAIRIDYGEDAITYSKNDGTVVTVQLSGGNLLSIDGLKTEYSAGRITGMGDYGFAWDDGSISSVSCGSEVFALTPSDFVLTCNIAIDLFCMLSWDGVEIENMPYFQTGFLGAQSKRLMQFAESNNRRFGYICVTDSKNRIVEIQEFLFVTKDGSTSNYRQKEYRLTYFAK